MTIFTLLIDQATTNDPHNIEIHSVYDSQEKAELQARTLIHEYDMKNTDREIVEDGVMFVDDKVILEIRKFEVQ